MCRQPMGQQHEHKPRALVDRRSCLRQTSAAPSSSELGIRVSVEPEYLISPPSEQPMGNVPRSDFKFDFDFEQRVLAEAEKETQNWSELGFEDHPPETTFEASSSSVGSAKDFVVSNYVAPGLDREAAELVVANYGDHPNKVQEFANGYNLLREMGFASKNIADALLMYDNDRDKTLEHLLNNSP